MEIRPRCYVATTNTASVTPESYLAKSLRYSRDNHEIAKDEATISKMEQVDKDINVRSKDEPQTIRCPKCGRTDYIRDMEKDMGIKGSHYKYKCINCNTYIKTEPQTDCPWK